MTATRVAVGGMAALLTIGPVAATPLVTAEEAQLPADNSRLRSGIERGLDIVPIYPAPKSGAIQSPFNFRVKFRAHGNTQIDLDSLVIVYKKNPAIDLTARVRRSLPGYGFSGKPSTVGWGPENKLAFFAPQNIQIPVAVSVYPDEIYAAPRSWVEKAFPKLIYFDKLPKGGHFAAWEQPAFFVSDVRAAFKSLRT